MYTVAKPAPYWSAALVVTFTTALCLLHLPYPLYPDQALFVLIARELADGVRYFSDIWDVKQPGIYWWYEAAGSLFGFNALGVRLMDLCWAILVTVLLWLLLRSRGSIVAILGPVFGFASFYAAATTWTLSQIEWLVCGPLVVLLLCLCPADRPDDGRHDSARYCVAGAMLATVALLKTMLVPVAGIMLLVAVGQDRWIGGQSWKRLIKREIAPAALGVVLVLAPVAIYLAIQGTLAMAVWTTFVYPGYAVHEYPAHPISMLMSSLRWFVGRVWILAPLALWAMYVGLRQGSRLTWLLVAWMAVAFLSITAQVLSFWFYHFDVFYIPLGLLAAIGFADAIERLTADRRPRLRLAMVAMVVVCAAVLMVVPLALKARLVAETRAFPADKQHRLELALHDGGVQELMDSANAVRPLTSASDRIVVWGDPRMYFVMDRRPLDEVDGGTVYLSSQLQAVAEVIRKKRPPLIFISKYRDLELINHGGGIIPRVVDKNYLPYYENAAGVWYQLRADKTSQGASLERVVPPAT